MNYYKRHLGDYAKDTRHLSLAEHGAFCLLLDYYYATEKPIPDDRCERIANAYADAERVAVRSVLREFFTETPAGWRNSKADSVIEEAQAKSLKAKESADARWGKGGSERNANASEKECERNASHKPLANSHKEKSTPVPKAKKAKAPELTLKDWLSTLDGDVVDAGDPIFAWAESTGIPADWIAVAWWMFEARYFDRDKRYADWRGAFRDHVKSDWIKAWRHDARDNRFVLTTAGELASREMAATQGAQA